MDASRRLRNWPRGGTLELEAKPSGQGEDLRLEVAPHIQFPIGGRAREGDESSEQ